MASSCGRRRGSSCCGTGDDEDTIHEVTTCRTQSSQDVFVGVQPPPSRGAQPSPGPTTPDIEARKAPEMESPKENTLTKPQATPTAPGLADDRKKPVSSTDVEAVPQASPRITKRSSKATPPEPIIIEPVSPTAASPPTRSVPPIAPVAGGPPRVPSLKKSPPVVPNLLKLDPGRLHESIEDWLRLITCCVDTDLHYFNREEQMLKCHLLYQLLSTEVVRLMAVLNNAIDTTREIRVRCNSCLINVDQGDSQGLLSHDKMVSNNAITTPSGRSARKSGRRGSLARLFTRRAKSRDQPPSPGSRLEKEVSVEADMESVSDMKLLMDNVPFLTSLLPPVFSRNFPGDQIVSLIRESFSKTELKEAANQLVKSLDKMEHDYMHEMHYRWTVFSSIISLFGANDRFNFTMQLLDLLSPKTQLMWRDTYMKYENNSAGSPDIISSVRIGSTGGNHHHHHSESSRRDSNVSPAVVTADRPQPDVAGDDEMNKGRIRRSLSKVRTRIHYHKTSNDGMTKLQVKVPKDAKDVIWTDDKRKGLTISYRFTDSGVILARITAKVACPLVNLLAVLYDVDNYKAWVPYTYESEVLATFSKACFIVSFRNDMPWPIRKRETLGFCHGVDAFDELGCVIISLATPTGDDVLGFKIPPPNPKIPRLPDSTMCFFLYPVAENRTIFQINAKIDPGISLRMIKGIAVWLVKSSCLDFLVKIANLGCKWDRSKSKIPNEFYVWIEGRVVQTLERRKNGGHRTKVSPQATSANNTNELEAWMRSLSTFRMNQ